MTSESSARDSVRIGVRVDSTLVMVHDSVWVDRWRSNDTVWMTTERWRTRTRDRIVETTDTFLVALTDTVYVETTRGRSCSLFSLMHSRANSRSLFSRANSHADTPRLRERGRGVRLVCFGLLGGLLIAFVLYLTYRLRKK